MIVNQNYLQANTAYNDSNNEKGFQKQSSGASEIYTSQSSKLMNSKSQPSLEQTQQTSLKNIS